MSTDFASPLPTTVYLYARKSTDAEDRQVLSIPSQLDELTALARNRGLTIAGTFTESKTAKKPGRKQFNAMIDQIRKGPCRAILAWSADRLSRNVMDTATLVYAMDMKVLDAVVTPFQTFQDTPADKMFFTQLCTQAKYDNDQKGVAVTRGLKKKLTMGWRPGWAPTGYMNDTATQTLLPDPERFPIIRRIWEYVLKGSYSAREIHRLARDQWGLTTRPRKRIGGRPITESAIYRILSDPFYAGMIRWKGELYEGKHLPMVTMAEFRRVQELLGLGTRHRPQKGTFALTGLFRCGSCGCMVTAEQKTKHQKNGNVHHYTYYRCTKKAGPCPEQYVEARNFDVQVQGFLSTFAPSDNYLSWAIRWLDGEEAKDTEAALAARRSKEQELRNAETKLQNLLDMRLGHLLTDEEYRTEKERLTIKVRVLNEEVTRLATEPARATTMTRDFLRFAKGVRFAFSQGTIQEKRQILVAVGSNLRVSAGKALISAKEPFSLLAKALNDAPAENGRLEPPKNGSDNRQSATHRDGFSANLRGLIDVRNYFLLHPEPFILPQLRDL